MSDDSRGLASRLLDAGRALGVERAVDTALDVLFARWVTLNAQDRAGGETSWASLLNAESEGDLAAGFTRLAFLSVLDLGAGEKLDVDPAVLRRVVGLIDRAVSRAGDARVLLASTFDAVLGSRSALGKQAGESETPPEVADLMAALVVRAGDRVFDPACGEATVLLAAATRRHAGAVSGFEINRRTSRRAMMRLLIHEVDTGSGFGPSTGDAFTEHEPEAADAVLVQPPWGIALSPGQRAVATELAAQWSVELGRRIGGDAAWLLLALDAMAAGTGRGVIALPASMSGPRFHRLHLHLLGLGVIEVVIALPAGLFANTAIPSALWVLRRPTSPTPAPETLMIDASSLARRSGHNARVVLLDDATDRIAEILDRWRAGASIAEPAHVARAVPIAELIAAPDLDPHRFLEAAPEEPIVHPAPERRLLTEVGLRSFKAFSKETRLPLAPLTFLYGPNSAGKSSVIQALLLLKQSQAGPRLLTQGPLVNVGTFRGIVHGHADTDLGISLGYGTLPQWLASGGAPDPGLPRLIEWTFAASPSGQAWPRRTALAFGDHELSLTREPDGDVFVIALHDAIEIFPGLATGRLLYPFDDHLKATGEETAERGAQNTPDNVRRAIKGFDRAGTNTIELRAQGLLPSAERLAEVPGTGPGDRESWFANSFAKRTAALAGGVCAEVSQLLEELVWLGPLRSAPERVYDRARITHGSGGGADVAFYLFDHATVVDQVNEWLTRLEVPYTLRVVPIAAGESEHLVGDLVAISLKDTRTGVVVTPADVGYGISQVLPIVVELLTRRECVIAIEQPETHLHPRLQARLADLLIDSVQAGGRANQLLVETHSEHMMLRVQRRIREGALDARDVSVLYVDREATGPATVRQLRLSDDGEFRDQWPGGFFDDRLDELFAGI